MPSASTAYDEDDSNDENNDYDVVDSVVGVPSATLLLRTITMLAFTVAASVI